MFCAKCGKEIDDSAVVCVGCGSATANMQKHKQETVQNPNQPPIIINNSSSSSAAASAAAAAGGMRRRRSRGFDIFMLIMTCGLWGIWMALRPKYY